MKNKLIEVERPIIFNLEEPVQRGLDMQRLPALSPSSAVMEGFQDCAEEAIRYLIEVEKLAADDPMVVGLREHLYEKQKSMLAYPVVHLQPPSISPQPMYMDSLGQFEDYSLRSDNVADDSSFDSSTDVSDITSLQTHEEQATDFYNVMNLCASRDNESAIRSLAEELISLMEEEEDIFTDDEDIDFDENIEDVYE
ncbi:hypothetical protein SNE40_018876 [Patella caerulea]|uniref:Uncharacterized protein n=1 Tax=Patella caerulea TaxID=87958 RepID=A0AAN8J5S9_PATCE